MIPWWLLVFAALAALLVCLRLLAHVELWQRKEYRLDRLWSMLATPERLSWLTLWWFLAMGGTALALWLWKLELMQESEFVASISFFVLFGQEIWRVVSRGIHRPNLTAKGTALLILSMLVFLGGAWLIFVIPTGLFLLLLVTVCSVPFAVAISVLVVNLPFAVAKLLVINRAAAYRHSLKKLHVTGITGSYGKTSTKFFLQQILSNEPGVVVSGQHRNSAVAIAQDMLHQLTPATRFYIAEMGAYKRGEVADLGRLVRPQVGTITAIGNQHLALFGSEEKILQAKWELIESLPTDGTAVLCTDDERLVQKAKTLKKKVIWFSLAKPADVYVENVKIEPQDITCLLHVGTKQQEVVIPLASNALLSSAIAASATAFALGVPASTIFSQLQKLTPYSRTMELTRGRLGAQIIDDSYSANEQGVLKAIDHLSRFVSSDKIIVLTPIIELGAVGPKVHERIGAALAKSGATVYLVNQSYLADVVRGGQEVKKDFSVTASNQPKQLAALLKGKVKPDSVVLLEGRAPEIIRQAVLK